MPPRRSLEDNLRLYNAWRGEHKRRLDFLDSGVADLLEEDENGRIDLRAPLTEEEWKLYDKWETRSKDPAYQRTREVITNRESRHRREKWHTIFLREFGPLIVFAIIAYLERDKWTYTDTLIIVTGFVMVKLQMNLLNSIRDTEENQLLREWELHEKVGRLLDIAYEMSRNYVTNKSFADSIDRLQTNLFRR